MKQKLEKAKNWAKEHKTEILVGTVTVIAGGVSIKLIKDVCRTEPKVDGLKDHLLPKLVKMDIPEELTGMVDEISHTEGQKIYEDLWLGNIMLTELGEFGEKLMKLDGYGEDSCINGGVVGLVRDCNEL